MAFVLKASYLNQLPLPCYRACGSGLSTHLTPVYSYIHYKNNSLLNVQTVSYNMEELQTAYITYITN